jgi:hypothetical protein
VNFVGCRGVTFADRRRNLETAVRYGVESPRVKKQSEVTSSDDQGGWSASCLVIVSTSDFVTHDVVVVGEKTEGGRMPRTVQRAAVQGDRLIVSMSFADRGNDER